MPARITGLDIGGAHLKVAQVDRNGRVLACVQVPCALWQGLDRLEFGLRQVRPAEDVREQVEGRRGVPGQGRAPEPHVHRPDALVPVDPEVVEREGELAAVTSPGPAGDQVGQDGSRPELARRVERGPGRDEEVDRGGPDVFHPLRQEDHPVRQRVLKNLLSHGGPFTSGGGHTAAIRSILRAAASRGDHTESGG